MIVAFGALVLGSVGCGGGGAISTSTLNTSAPPSAPKITHVVVIFQENRTPDNLFHGLPNADIASSGINSKGETVPLQPISLANDYDLGHGHPHFAAMYDGGRMDGTDHIPYRCVKRSADCPGPNLQFKYVNPSEVQPYFQLAERYSFADRMFQTNQGPSFPAHQFIIDGTSAPTAGSDVFAAENPVGPGAIWTNVGCMAPSGQTVTMIDPSGDESANQYPCFEHPVITDLLDEKEISWKCYTPLAGSIWTGPNGIEHLRTGPAWANVILKQKQVLSDITDAQLPQVSWVIPTAHASDHPEINNGSGPSWVASIVNSIGTSTYWSSTAIFITWDDWGGWYDHVAPPIYNSPGRHYRAREGDGDGQGTRDGRSRQAG